MDKEAIDELEPELNSSFSMLISSLTVNVIFGTMTKEKALSELEKMQYFLSKELNRVNGGIAIIQQLKTIKGNTNVRN